MRRDRARLLMAAAAVVVGNLGTNACELPPVSDLSLNLTGAHGHSTNTTINNNVSAVLADVQQVRYDASNSYVNATNIPSHDVGPWTGNPNMASNQNFLFRVPLSPQVQGGAKTATALGGIGFMVNGVEFFNASDGMSYMNRNVWHQNANVFEVGSFDAGKGHPQQTGAYHYHQAPNLLRTQLGDDGSHHSPLLGFAFDGFPVYGPYGWSNTDGTGSITRLDSSYRLRNITTRNTLPNGTVLTGNQIGPTTASVALGSYLEDYEYVAGLGALDQYNGRTAVTPEYPEGTYAYFTTIDSLGAAAYPYIVGPSYNGVLQNDNRTQTVSVPGGVSTFSAALLATWSTAAGGLWCDGPNWSGGVSPVGIGTSATFAAVVGAPAGGITVTLDDAQRVGSMQFTTSTPYTVGGDAQLTLLTPAGSTVTVSAGDHAITAPMVIGSATTFDVAAGAQLHVTRLQHMAVPLTKSGAGTLELTGLYGTSLTVSAGKVVLASGTGAAHRVTSLSVAAGAKVDLTSSRLIIAATPPGSWNGSSYSGASGLIQSGRFGGWMGNGIVTSQSAALGGNYTGLGIARASDIGITTTAVWCGQTVSSTDTLILYTYGGDANLDGKLNIDDYVKIDTGIAAGLSGWANGDFNYDGKINIDDYTMVIDSNIGTQGTPFGTADSVATSSLVAVPEPAGLACVVGYAAFGMVLARRRRSCS